MCRYNLPPCDSRSQGSPSVCGAHSTQLKAQQNESVDVSFWIMSHVWPEIWLFFSSAASDWFASFILGHDRKELAPFFCSSLTSRKQLQLAAPCSPVIITDGPGGRGERQRTRVLEMIYTFPGRFALHRMTPKLGDQSHFKDCYR